MRSTRLFVLMPLFAAAAVTSLQAQEPIRLRIMAANISSGPFQSYPNPGPGVRIFQALRPDVVLIQEFNVNSSSGGANDQTAVRSWIDDVFGPDFHFCREPGNEQIPNGIVSRWPITECDEWEDVEVGNRDFTYARIDIPGSADLWAVSLHLLTRNASVRNREASALVRAISEHAVPAQDLLVIGGDFNTDNRSEPALTTLSSLVVVAPPFPDDGESPPDGDTNAARRKPYDWLLADAELDALKTAVAAGSRSFPNGLVFDSRVFAQSELDADFTPVQAGDSGAAQMQHMAVVRDFLLNAEQNPEADWSVSAPREVDYGRRAAAEAPFVDTRLTVTLRKPVSLLSVGIMGDHSDEFALLAPLPGPLQDGEPLRFQWTPLSDDGDARSATAVLTVDGSPETIRIVLRGETGSIEPEGEPFDLSGWVVEQTGGSARITLPDGLALAPGASLVIGRQADRAEFEQFWGPLPQGAVYLNGADLIGGVGFPIINGGEGFRLLDPQGRPQSGFLPGTATPSGRSYQRLATDGPDFQSFADAQTSATPGAYSGTASGNGAVVITEFSDAPGAGNWIFEFVELFHDGKR